MKDSSGTVPGPARVSALILTRNEEAALPRCLASVEWCDRVIVLDSGSTDRTVEMARAAGAAVIERPFDDFARQRNHGLDHGGFEDGWVLHVDADEVVTSDLRDEILAVVPHSGHDAYRVPSRMIFRGRWLKYAGLYPSYQVRLGRVGALRFRQMGHGQREMAGLSVGTLRGALLHHTFEKGLDDWFDRHNRYSRDEARQEVGSGSGDEPRLGVGRILSDPVERRRWLKRTSARLPFRPTLRFLYMYVLRGGFLDGGAGYEYCRLLALYEAMTVLKVRELRRRSVDRDN